MLKFGNDKIRVTFSVQLKIISAITIPNVKLFSMNKAVKKMWTRNNLLLKIS